MFCARASSLFIKAVTSGNSIGATGSRIVSRSFITNAKKFNNTKTSSTKVLIACGEPKSLFSNKAVRAQLRSASIDGILVMQRRNYTELSEAEKKERVQEAARKVGGALISVTLWGGATWLVFKYLHPIFIGLYCLAAGVYLAGKGVAAGLKYYMKKRLTEDVHLLPNLHDVLRQNRDRLTKSIGNFTMPEMESVVSWRARSPGAPSTDPEYLHYTTYVKGDKSRLWLRARGFQQGDTWVLEKVLVDVLSPEADAKLRKEETEIEAGTYKRDTSEDQSEEDPRAYFVAETITLHDIKPESKLVDLDADQIEVLNQERNEQIEQARKEEEEANKKQ